MTIKEAQYFKKYIDERLNDILGAMTQQQLNTLQGQRFAARFMGEYKRTADVASVGVPPVFERD